MKLSADTLRVIGAAMFDADVSATEIAAQVEMSVGMVNYHLKKALDANLLQPQCLMDIYPLRLAYHGIFFSIDSPAKVSRLVSLFRAHPSTAFIQEYVGTYRLAVGIIAMSAGDALTIFHTVIEQGGVSVIKKGMTTRTALYEIPRRYLFPNTFARPFQLYGGTTKRVTLSDKEFSFLTQLTTTPVYSYREAARVLQLPHSTFVHRLKVLKDQGIFLKRSYEFQATSAGFVAVKALIYCSGYQARRRQQLRDYLLEHLHAVHLVECFGAWDMEVNFEVRHTAHVQQVIDEILGKFTGYVSDVVPLILVEQRLRRFLPEHPSPK